MRLIQSIIVLLLASGCTFKVVGETRELVPPKMTAAAGHGGSIHTDIAAGAVSGVIGKPGALLGKGGLSGARSETADSSASGGSRADFDMPSDGGSAETQARVSVGGTPDRDVTVGGTAATKPRGTFEAGTGSTYELGGTSGATSDHPKGGAWGAGGASEVPSGGVWSSAGAPGAGGSLGAAGSSGWIDSNGWFTAGSWHGKISSWLSTSSSTGTVSIIRSDSSVCAAGSLDADPSWKLNGSLGFGLNQAGPVQEPWEVTGTGLTIKFSNAGLSTLRMFIGNGDTGEYHCVQISDFQSPLTVAWSDFNTTCWDGLGTSLSLGSVVTVFGVYAQSRADATEEFDFCVEELMLNP